MSATLIGADDLQARFKALQKNVFKPAAKGWAKDALEIARQSVPPNVPSVGRKSYSKGRLVGSLKIRMSTGRRVSKARIVGHYTGYFVDAGVVPHSLQRRKSRPKGKLGRTIFSAAARKQHPGYPARPFRGAVTHKAHERHPALEYAIKAWNEAA